MREKLVSSHANDTMLGDVCVTDYFAQNQIFLTGSGSVVNNVLRSPRYPSDYPNSMYCVYRVIISYDKQLKIYFN